MMFTVLFRSFFSSNSSFLKYFFGLFFMGTLILSFFFFVNDYDEYADYLVNSQSKYNYYSIEGNKKQEALEIIDDNIVKYSYAYKSARLYLSTILTVDGVSRSSRLLERMEFATFDEGRVPKDLENLTIGSLVVKNNEIILSKEYALQFVDEDNLEELIGRKMSITITGSVGETDLDGDLLVDYTIVGIQDFSFSSMFFSFFGVLSNEDFIFPSYEEKTLLYFNTFSLNETLDKLDSLFEGEYHAWDLVKRMNTMEKQSRFATEILFELSILVTMAVCYNLYILVKFDFSKKVRLYSMFDLLGISKKRILINHFTNSVVVSFLAIIGAFILSNSLVSKLASEVFVGEFKHDAYSLDNIKVTSIFFGFDVLCLFIFFFLNYYSFFKKDAILNIKNE